MSHTNEDECPSYEEVCAPKKITIKIKKDYKKLYLEQKELVRLLVMAGGYEDTREHEDDDEDEE